MISFVGSKEIIEAASKAFGVSVKDVRSDKRHASITAARHVAMWLCRTRLHLSYPEIGEEFGRHHTSVMYAVKKLDGPAEPGSRTALLKRVASGIDEDLG